MAQTLDIRFYNMQSKVQKICLMFKLSPASIPSCSPLKSIKIVYL